VNEESARTEYRDKARIARQYQTKYRDSDKELSLEELEQSFRKELADADEWFAGVRNDEMTWIGEGKDPEKEFTLKYYEEPEVAADTSELLPQEPFFQRTFVQVHIALGAIVLLLVVPPALMVLRWRRARRARLAAPDAARLPSSP
jgi:hypothetical protein